MLWMKQNCHPVSEVNSFINEIVAMSTAPIAVTWFESFQSSDIFNRCWWTRRTGRCWKHSVPWWRWRQRRERNRSVVWSSASGTTRNGETCSVWRFENIFKIINNIRFLKILNQNIPYPFLRSDPLLLIKLKQVDWSWWFVLYVGQQD